MGSFDDDSIRITNLDSQFKNFSVLIGHSDKINSLAQLSNYKLMASGARDSNIIIWNLTKMKHLKTLKSHKASVTALVSLVNYQNYLISGSADKTVKIWSNLKLLQTLNDHTDSVLALAYMHRYNYLATGSRNSTINIYKFEKYEYYTLAAL